MGDSKVVYLVWNLVVYSGDYSAAWLGDLKVASTVDMMVVESVE